MSVALITPTASAQLALRALLAGETPTPRPADQWTPIIDELARVEDLAARRRAFDAAAKANPALRALLAGQARVAAAPVVTATDVLRMQFPDLRWIVPGLLPPGYTLFAGRPKQGKSWLMLQLGLAVGTGGQALGEQVEQGHVLICALEDGYRRLQDRMQAQRWPDPCDAVQFVTSLDELGGSLDGPGLAALEQRIETHNLRLVVIDTLARAFRISDLNDMAKTTAALDSLQSMAVRRGIAIVVIHHTNKVANEDFVSDPAGSTGLSAVADGIMVLKRRRGDNTATLEVVHRDLGTERSVALAWDRELACWQATGDAAAQRREHEQRDILDAIHTLSQLNQAATPSTIGDIVERNRGGVFKDLADLVTRGMVLRASRRGSYVLSQQGDAERQRDASSVHAGKPGNRETGKPGNRETGAGEEL